MKFFDFGRKLFSNFDRDWFFKSDMETFKTLTEPNLHEAMYSPKSEIEEQYTKIWETISNLTKLFPAEGRDQEIQTVIDKLLAMAKQTQMAEKMILAANLQEPPKLCNPKAEEMFSR